MEILDENQYYSEKFCNLILLEDIYIFNIDKPKSWYNQNAF